MSHYARPRKNYGRKLFNKESTHKVSRCWNCGFEIIQQKEAYHRQKVCVECKKKLTDQEIKVVYAKRYQHLREQLWAKRTRPDQDRFIFNSPFRKKS